MSELLPHEQLWTLTNAVVASRSLHLVAELGVADHLGEEPVPATELARRCGADPTALDRVLRLLAAHGIFEVTPAGYTHRDASRLLATDHPQSMRAFARLMSLPVCQAALASLDHSVRTGAPAVERLEPAGFFAYLQAHPAEAQVFGEAMAAKAQADIEAVLATYDFGPFRTIADIGGGRGHLIQAILDTTPAAHGVLFDLPEVIAALDVTTDRLDTHAGDFFVDDLPSADAYVLMEVIHDWTDKDATRILEAIRRSAAPGATVLIIEDIAPDQGTDPRVLTLDVVMLAVTGGRERTDGELAHLLHAAGFRRTAFIETGGPMRILEAVAI
jgi:O-methyltransferase